MRGFGISLLPAAVTTISICGSRLFWIFAVFPRYHEFYWIMMAYPVSLPLPPSAFLPCSYGIVRPIAWVMGRKSWLMKLSRTDRSYS